MTTRPERDERVWPGAVGGPLALWVMGTTIVVLVDQLTKQLVAIFLRVGRATPIVPGVLSIRHVRNPVGLFRSLLQLDSGVRALLLVLVPLAIIGGLLLAFRKLGESDNRLTVPLGLVVGGAVGNLIDRLLRASVIDFIQLSVGPFQLKVFNLADVAMIIGVVLIALDLFRRVRASA